MQEEMTKPSESFINQKAAELSVINRIDSSYYETGDVKRGLRNADGTGVVAGVSKICNVRGYIIQDNEKVPIDGNLSYRGIDIVDIVNGFQSEGRFGYEETAYLLLFGKLPNQSQLETFNKRIAEYRALPDHFTENTILSAPSKDIMNKLSRCVLAFYSYDQDPEPSSIDHELRQALMLIARCPVTVAHAYAAKKHYFDHESLFLHMPQENLSIAENFLYAIRRDNNFTDEEAKLLDLCLVLHAEHGGGNNSTFACRVLSSSGTDIYSSLAAAIGSLKGPRHGGANKKVMEMFEYIKAGVRDWADDGEVSAFLAKLIQKEAGDKSGLIYGMGHAVYTKSDPRAVILKRMARSLAEKKGMLAEFDLYERVERLTPHVFLCEKGDSKVISANVDMFSGFVYKMLDIPEDFYTPLFAVARIVGWCAHRIEEVYNSNKIIRPAYRVVAPATPYVPMKDRG